MWGLRQKEKDAQLKWAIGHDEWEAARKAIERGADPNFDYPGYGTVLFRVVTLRSDSIAAELAGLLVAQGADINKTSGDSTPLTCLIASRPSNLSTLKVLLERGADMTVPCNGVTPLRMAVTRGLWQAAEAMLDRNPALERQTQNGETLLLTALGKGASLSFLKRLMEKPMDVNAKAYSTAPALHVAVTAGRQDVVDYLLSLPGIDVNIPDSGRKTPLQVAVAADNRDMAASLLKAGADPNRADAEGKTPLLVAAGLEVSALTKTLLAAGAAPEQADKAGATPLLAAAAAKNRSTTGMLLAAGAAPDKTDGRGLTPLLQAVLVDATNVVAALLDAGARPGQAALNGLLPLTVAAEHGTAPIVKALLAAAEAASTPLDLTAALFIAAEKGHGSVIEHLVAAGADVNAADGEGRTPLMKACLTDKIEVMSMLIKAGAKPEDEDKRGMQAYDHAVAGAKGQAKDYLARFRSSEGARGPAQGSTQGSALGVAGSGEEDRYKLLNSHSLEVRETDSLSLIFNFWTQQLMVRDTALGGPVALQNFSDIQRQEAIEEAFGKLKALGGDPPEPRALSLQKKSAGPSKGLN